MADVVVNDTSLLDIGNAIREKNGTQTKYKPVEMGPAIRAISGGGEPVDTKIFKFQNYNGDLVAEYTVEELAALQELPPLPLTADEEIEILGWPISLDDCHYMASQSWYKENGLLCVPKIQHTKNMPVGTSIKIVIHPDEECNFAQIYSYIAYENRQKTNVSIDWGDGQELKFILDTQNVYRTDIHTYSEINRDYTIKIYYDRKADFDSAGLFNCSRSAKGRLASSKVKSIIMNGGKAKDLLTYAVPDMLEYAITGQNTEIFSSNLSMRGQNIAGRTDPSKKVKFINVTGKSSSSYDECYIFCNFPVRHYIYSNKYSPFYPSTQDVIFSRLTINELEIPERINNISDIDIVNDSKNVKFGQRIIYPSNSKSISYLPMLDYAIFDFSKSKKVVPLTRDNLSGAQEYQYKILVPSALYDSWIADTNWSALASIIEAV